ncbi:MAG: hypothetical protein L6290_06250 [Thermodesulfovibrionales bacterium]|nr:hypothetical protein [Thermodesulfovibrionales bacterium]
MQINKISFKVLIIILLLMLPYTIFAEVTERKNLANSLTKEFKQKGWPALTLKASGEQFKTISIHQSNVTQKPKLTDGQLTSVLGTLLEPDVVNRLKKVGFEKGNFIDGRSRSYPFEISRKYYDKMENFYKSF